MRTWVTGIMVVLLALAAWGCTMRNAPSLGRHKVSYPPRRSDRTAVRTPNKTPESLAADSVAATSPPVGAKTDTNAEKQAHKPAQKPVVAEQKEEYWRESATTSTGEQSSARLSPKKPAVQPTPQPASQQLAATPKIEKSKPVPVIVKENTVPKPKENVQQKQIESTPTVTMVSKPPGPKASENKPKPKAKRKEQKSASGQPRKQETPVAAVATSSGNSGGDSDGDGVADFLDMCPNTPRGMDTDSTGCLIMTQLQRQLVLQLSTVDGKNDLDKMSRLILDDLVIRMRGEPGVVAVIKGFTDHRRSDSLVVAASEERIASIAKYISMQGIDGKRIQALPPTPVSADDAAIVASPDNVRIEISFQPEY